MSPMTMPKPSEQAKAAFQKLVPPDPNVTTRPMFGNLAGFVNGNMFCGLFGEDLFVRVSEDDQAKVRKQGGRPFEVMPGRAMTGYVMVAAGWQKKTRRAPGLSPRFRGHARCPRRIKRRPRRGSEGTSGGAEPAEGDLARGLLGVAGVALHGAHHRVPDPVVIRRVRNLLHAGL